MRSLILVVLALCLVAVIAQTPAEQRSNKAITLESTVAKEDLKQVTVVAAPPKFNHHNKIRGNFTHRPLLENEYLKARIPRKYRTDLCTGCSVPVKVHPKLDPRNRLDRKGNVIGKKRVLPVEPELREREPKLYGRAARRAARREARREARKAIREANMRPEFYPLTHKQRKDLRKANGQHPARVVARLPNVPEFYPAPKPKRLFNPPGGWPSDDCHGCPAKDTATAASASAPTPA